MTFTMPIVGKWYEARDGVLFEVVAMDADEETIEVQHFDGTLEEFDYDGWQAEAPIEADEPEDWTGSLDVDPEDHDEEVELNAAPEWLGSGQLDRDEVGGYSEVPVQH